MTSSHVTASTSSSGPRTSWKLVYGNVSGLPGCEKFKRWVFVVLSTATINSFHIRMMCHDVGAPVQGLVAAADPSHCCGWSTPLTAHRRSAFVELGAVSKHHTVPGVPANRRVNAPAVSLFQMLPLMLRMRNLAPSLR